MSKDINSLVKGLGKKHGDKQKEIKAYSEWPKCTRAGCPLMTTIKCDDLTCSYHFRLRGYEADCMTEAIKENIPYINKLKEMTYWNVRTWHEKKAQLMGWPVLPATEQEMDLPTLFLNRFKKWIDKKIEEDKESKYRNG